MFQTSHIEISRSALIKNIRFLKRHLPSTTKFSSVIKGNAYGHSIDLFVPLAEKAGISHFSVFSADEALAAKESSHPNTEIMIMGAIDTEELNWAIENDVSFYAFEMGRLKNAANTAKKLKKKAKTHLELETGLHRTGFEQRDLSRALKYITSRPEQLKLEGICTHYAGAESMSNYLRITHQIALYNALCNKLAARGIQFGPGKTLRHTACSAAALVYPETRMDMVRIGIAQYGYWPSKETEINFFHRVYKVKRPAIKDPLIRVIKWVSRIMSIKRVRRGDFVGYGSSCLATRDQTLAAVPVGYFHGFARSLSNVGHVLVRGRRAPVVGTVNMNLTMVDVTDIEGAQLGDEVVIIGKQGDRTISVGAFGEMTRAINYETLVRLPTEIPRVVVK